MEELAAVLLRGEAADWPSDAARAEQERFLRMAAGHGVSSLLAYQLRRTLKADMSIGRFTELVEALGGHWQIKVSFADGHEYSAGHRVID